MRNRSLWTTHGRGLTEHLEQLRCSLDTLGLRLRDAVAHAVGQAVGEAVREAVRAALRDPPTEESLPCLLPFARRPGERFCYKSETDWRPEGTWDEPFSEAVNALRAYPGATMPPPQTQSPTSRWRPALLVGWEVTGWWLQRAGPRPLPKAVTVGLAAALAAYAAGPALTTSALGLFNLAEILRCAIATLPMAAEADDPDRNEGRCGPRLVDL
jgi:hypothetical protein